MRVTATDEALEVIERAQAEREGDLTITLGTGCCESTAPFLYENNYAGPDHQQVGQVGGIPVLAPALLRELYANDELVITVVHEFVDSLSIETDWGIRLALRGQEQAV